MVRCTPLLARLQTKNICATDLYKDLPIFSSSNYIFAFNPTLERWYAKIIVDQPMNLIYSGKDPIDVLSVFLPPREWSSPYKLQSSHVSYHRLLSSCNIHLPPNSISW